MIWQEWGGCFVSGPYRVVPRIKDYEIWRQTKDKYGILARGITTLSKAKDFAEDHKKKAETCAGS